MSSESQDSERASSFEETDILIYYDAADEDEQPLSPFVCIVPTGIDTSMLQDVAQGTMKVDPSTRIDILESLRLPNLARSSIETAWTASTGSPPSSGGYIPTFSSSPTTLSTPSEVTSLASVDPDADVLAQILAYNDMIKRQARGRDTISKIERTIYDEDKRKMIWHKYMKEAAIEHKDERDGLKARIADAKARHDSLGVEEAEKAKRVFNGRLLQDFEEGLLENLADAMNDAEMQQLRELKETQKLLQAQQILTAPPSLSPLQLVEEAEAAREQVLAELNDTIEAITDCHIDEAMTLLGAANHATRKGAQRMRRLWAEDVSDEDERKLEVERRMADPAAALFITKSHLEMAEAKAIAEMVGATAEKVGKDLGKLENGLIDVMMKQQNAVLSLVERAKPSESTKN